eukprot:jgi/Bigna1/67399/fgenesh1_pg.3_\
MSGRSSDGRGDVASTGSLSQTSYVDSFMERSEGQDPYDEMMFGSGPFEEQRRGRRRVDEKDDEERAKISDRMLICPALCRASWGPGGELLYFCNFFEEEEEEEEEADNMAAVAKESEHVQGQLWQLHMKESDDEEEEEEEEEEDQGEQVENDEAEGKEDGGGGGGGDDVVDGMFDEETGIRISGIKTYADLLAMSSDEEKQAGKLGLGGLAAAPTREKRAELKSGGTRPARSLSIDSIFEEIIQEEGHSAAAAAFQEEDAGEAGEEGLMDALGRRRRIGGKNDDGVEDGDDCEFGGGEELLMQLRRRANSRKMRYVTTEGARVMNSCVALKVYSNLLPFAVDLCRSLSIKCPGDDLRAQKQQQLVPFERSDRVGDHEDPYCGRRRRRISNDASSSSSSSSSSKGKMIQMPGLHGGRHGAPHVPVLDEAIPGDCRCGSQVESTSNAGRLGDKDHRSVQYGILPTADDPCWSAELLVKLRACRHIYAEWLFRMGALKARAEILKYEKWASWGGRGSSSSKAMQILPQRSPPKPPPSPIEIERDHGGAGKAMQATKAPPSGSRSSPFHNGRMTGTRRQDDDDDDDDDEFAFETTATCNVCRKNFEAHCLGEGENDDWDGGGDLTCRRCRNQPICAICRLPVIMAVTFSISKSGSKVGKVFVPPVVVVDALF